MNTGVENIGKKDVIWSYVATIFMVGSGILLLPFILHMMPSETVGIWNIFTVVTSLVTLLDFGFRPSFARNVSYIFSGVRKLKAYGVETVEESNDVDYDLLSTTISVMRSFYKWMALSVFLILSTVGTAYFYFILCKYTGDHLDALTAWILLIIINSYNLYTLYYDALLMGKGYVMKNQQITIVGQVTYLTTAIVLIYCGFGLTAIISSKLLSVFIRRQLSYRVFFTKNMQALLSRHSDDNKREIFKAIIPNAVKVGCTNLGGFLVNRSAILMGSAFLSLEQVACYGITIQVIEILSQCSNVIYKSYVPKLAQYRTSNDLLSLRRIYISCVMSMICIYLIGGTGFIFFGNKILNIIGSGTHFLSSGMLTTMLFVSFLESNHAMSAGFISADNRIPFFIPSLLSGLATVILLWLFLSHFHLVVWGLILAPGIAQLIYQNWKWPSVVIRELFFSPKIK